MSNRSNLGFGDEIEDASVAKNAPVLDLSDFKPKPVARPDQADIAKAAEKTNFKSRESKPTVVAVPVKATRRRRTGRSAQLNLKARQDTIDSFYAIADARGWVLGEAFEKAVALLQQEYGPASPANR